MYQFPKDFLWGSATAAFQIEGASQADGRGDSIWDAFCREPGAVLGGDDGSVACDHYNRMPSDVALMASLGLQSYRFSTSWARVCPDGMSVNQLGLDFYSRLVDELLAHDIRPWITLYHWDLPAALPGGWTNRDTAYRFADFAEVVHDRLGDRVSAWTTLNEPWCSSFLSYAAGEHAPGHTSGREAVAAVHHLLLGHGLTVERLRALNPEVELGITLNPTWVEPSDPENPIDLDAARRVDGVFNRIFLDPIFKGTYPQDVLEDMAAHGFDQVIEPGDLSIISQPVEILGINYYSTQAVSGIPSDDYQPQVGPAGRLLGSPLVGSEWVKGVPRNLPVTAMGWEVEPGGLTKLLKRIHNEYTGPVGTRIYITENGAAYDDVADDNDFVDDQDRISYIREHLIALHDAIEAGVDVRGYFVWSLMDNFEWAFGYSKRFGVVRVNYETLKRTPKASALWFAEVARTNSVETVAS